MAATTAALQDAAILTGDTYLTAKVELIQSGSYQLAGSSSSGQAYAVAALPTRSARYALEAGYNSAGHAALNLYALPPSGAPSNVSEIPARTVQLKSGTVEARDAAGQSIIPPPEVATGIRPILNYTGTAALTFLDGIRTRTIPAVGSTTALLEGTQTVTQVTSANGMTTVHLRLTSSTAGEVPMTQRKVYVQSQGSYVLHEVQTDVVSASTGITISGVSTVRFSEVAWSQNQQKDAARASSTSGTTWGDAPIRTELAPPPPPCDPYYEMCGEDPPPTGGGGTGGGGNGGSTTYCPTYSTGANLTFVHGIWSQGATWGSPYTGTGVRGRSYCGMQIASTRAIDFTDGGRRSHQEQTAQLATYVQAPSSGTEQILIGHSQGGIVSRRLAHSVYGQGNPNRLIRGVVTIGTPHAGATIANSLSNPGTGPTPAAAIADVLSHRIVRRVLLDGGRTAEAFRALDASIRAPSGSAAMLDLRPSSQAISLLRAQASLEAFPRFGIQHVPSDRWIFGRLAGDFFATNGGPTVVTILDVLTATAFASIIVSILWPPAAIAAAVLSTAVSAAGLIEEAWSLFAGIGEESDGVVSFNSQTYPGLPAEDNYLAEDPTTHTGQTNTQRSYAEVERVLTTRLGVQPP